MVHVLLSAMQASHFLRTVLLVTTLRDKSIFHRTKKLAILTILEF
jgi:hypothetical protein